MTKYDNRTHFRGSSYTFRPLFWSVKLHYSRSLRSHKGHIWQFFGANSHLRPTSDRSGNPCRPQLSTTCGLVTPVIKLALASFRCFYPAPHRRTHKNARNKNKCKNLRRGLEAVCGVAWWSILKLDKLLLQCTSDSQVPLLGGPCGREVVDDAIRFWVVTSP